MNKANVEKRNIDLGTNFEGAVRVNGVCIEVSAGGDIVAYTNGSVKLRPPANGEMPSAEERVTASVNKQAYNIGDVLPDGWVVGPMSPTTGKPMAIEPVSGALKGYETWHKGEEHAEALRIQGHTGARQPDFDELNAIYNGVVKAGRNRNAQFDVSGFKPYSGYWSSTTLPVLRRFARVRFFSESPTWHSKDDAYAHVRCVRDEPGLTLA